MTKSGAGNPKVTTFTATHEDGQKYRWSFWRDANLSRWFLCDYDGYIRPLETTWIDSLPRIRLILENHGSSANIS